MPVRIGPEVQALPRTLRPVSCETRGLPHLKARLRAVLRKGMDHRVALVLPFGTYRMGGCDERIHHLVEGSGRFPGCHG